MPSQEVMRAVAEALREFEEAKASWLDVEDSDSAMARIAYQQKVQAERTLSRSRADLEAAIRADREREDY